MSLELLPAEGEPTLADVEVSVEPLLLDGAAAALLVDGLVLLALMSEGLLPAAALVPLGDCVLALLADEGLVLPAAAVLSAVELPLLGVALEAD